MVYNLGGPDGAGRDPGRADIAHAVSGRHDGTGQGHDARQLDALDAGYTYSLLWVAGIAVLVGAAALWIGFTARQIAAAQHTREAVEAGELEEDELEPDEV